MVEHTDADGYTLAREDPIADLATDYLLQPDQQMWIVNCPLQRPRAIRNRGAQVNNKNGPVFCLFRTFATLFQNPDSIVSLLTASFALS